jgi:hypothetical protein
MHGSATIAQKEENRDGNTSKKVTDHLATSARSFP